MTLKDIFSFNLKWMLYATELSQNKLSKMVGVSQQTVNCWINGKKLPSLETFQKLCEVLDVRADFLLGFSDNNYPAIVRWTESGLVFREDDEDDFIMTDLKFL